MIYQFNVPIKTYIGKNSLLQAENDISCFGKKALIVTGKHVSKTDSFLDLLKSLDKLTIDYVVYSEITGEPTDIMITNGVDIYKNNNCEFVIGIGGGSPLDSSKAISAMTVLDGELADYMGKEIRGKFPPVVLIPTTAGTGSETTKFTIITDLKNNVKMLLKGDDLLPKLAIVDYTYSISSPASITAATGMDALTHAIESYTSRKANDITDMFALSAIEKIFKYLPIAYKDRNNEEAREQMATAAYYAGICINNASVTLVHGMSRPIGALFHVPHGISNAMLLKECMMFAVDGCYSKFAVMARKIGVADALCTDKEAAELFIKALENLCSVLDIPSVLGYGINRDEYESVIDKMSNDAMNSGSPSNTIKETSKNDLVDIYKKLIM